MVKSDTKSSNTNTIADSDGLERQQLLFDIPSSFHVVRATDDHRLVHCLEDVDSSNSELWLFRVPPKLDCAALHNVQLKFDIGDAEGGRDDDKTKKRKRKSKELHFTIDDNMYSLVDGDPMESSQFVCLHPSAKSETFYPCKPFSREFNIVRRVQGEAPQLLKQKQVIQQISGLKRRFPLAGVPISREQSLGLASSGVNNDKTKKHKKKDKKDKKEKKNKKEKRK